MAIVKKKNYRKKKIDSDDEADITVVDPTEGIEQVSATIEELAELRKLRRKHVGIDIEKLLKGSDKKKKKKKLPQESNSWNLKKGGLVDADAYKQKMEEDDPTTVRKLKLDSFATATNTLDVDKHMMEYIESEMRKRRGGSALPEDEEDNEENVDRGLVDIYEDLYRIPDRLKGGQKQESEGNVQLSSQMLTAIPEVDLGIDTRLKNIEETERAKRKLIDETQKEENKPQSEEDFVPANFEKQIPKQFKPRLDHKLMATDEQVAARFKKRMRK
ncbi:hypothetical protein MFLAVUS_003854 [Mucor flavus]|uniref:Hepatocellular carcinoma-associated antigen 59 n=1 Tax=Mucor flavus TaxID=439312 RepID=A0ABP9YU97_9FUNG